MAKLTHAEEYAQTLEDFFLENGLYVIRADPYSEGEGKVSVMLSLYRPHHGADPSTVLMHGGTHVARVYVYDERLSVTGSERKKIARLLDSRLNALGFAVTRRGPLAKEDA